MDAAPHPPGRSRGRRMWGRAALAVGARPALWPTALRQARRLTVPGWWRRPPFLPRPDRAYLRFRLETQYGAAGAPTAARDVVSYLEWCRDEQRSLSGHPEGRR